MRGKFTDIHYKICYLLRIFVLIYLNKKLLISIYKGI